MPVIESAVPPSAVDRGANDDIPLSLARETHAAFGRLLAKNHIIAAHERCQYVVHVAHHLLQLAEALGCNVWRSPTTCFAGSWPDVPYLASANHCANHILVLLAAGAGTHAERAAVLQKAYTLLHMDCARHGFALGARLGSRNDPACPGRVPPYRGPAAYT